MPDTSPAAGGFAVVEMFTSQGCNSCPPAEELLSEIDRDARRHGRPVHALGFHVDYWDHLGWADPYGAQAHTLRQEAYARAFGSGGLYTPQMIVNGTVEFVGSDRRQADSAIAAALARPPATTLTLTVAGAGAGAGAGDRVVLDYATGPLPAQSVLNVAVVERGLENHVPRGENAGRTLRQDGVVRAFTATPVDTQRGRVELQVPPAVDPHRASVVGYLQNDADKSVVAATAVDL
ncbi:DUF1223 domain-containing protein [Micromonospora mirobrigensis]|uniref:DUF1223 domain-containing protein n=1 Tax=Micromonospora mirobrigensis TaxID=262898 RepID=A0A1C4Z527_9ACTN|nr:DUF1223 domain-containing protein [Micromonospora mirobrigensis]SCF28043.1 Protein of unknown function (DUF1223) [Micromonospora mirobrigensis]